MPTRREPVRWGVLSTAKINDKFLGGAQGADGVQVLAVASRDGARARAYAQERDIPRAYGSYEELLGDPELDAVYIPLPNALHVPWTLRALEAASTSCAKSRSRAGARTPGVWWRWPPSRACGSARRSCTATTHRSGA